MLCALMFVSGFVLAIAGIGFLIVWLGDEAKATARR
jgi:hypothetical protein